MRFWYKSDPLTATRSAVFVCVYIVSYAGRGGKERVEGELTYGSRGGAVVVGGGRERHVFVMGYSRLWFGQDIVEAIFQESPSSDEVGVWGRCCIGFCGHFVRW